MRIYPASHYTMGGLWVDYELQTTIPGPVLHRRRGQLLRPRRQPPRCLGADAGPVRRLLRAPVHDRSVPRPICSTSRSPTRPRGVRRRRGRRRAIGTRAYLDIGGTKTPDHFHRKLGKIIWDYCGMARNQVGLEKALAGDPGACTRSSRPTCVSPGTVTSLNQTLEKAARVDDFFELGMLMCQDALDSRGVLWRPLPRGVPDRRGRGASATTTSSPTSPRGSGAATRSPIENREQLEYEVVQFATRSYK